MKLPLINLPALPVHRNAEAVPFDRYGTLVQ
jgi:hypothetical protein